MTDSQREFINGLVRLDRSKGLHYVFRDFCELAYCAYAKLTAHSDAADQLEERYMNIVESYNNKDDIRAMPSLLAIAYQAVAGGGEDFLGSVAGELELLDARAGQFFTPYPVSRLMAEVILEGADTVIEKNGFFTLQEPAAGTGRMVLAAADVLDLRGHDPSKHILVNAIDISAICFHMCYLQLTFRGIPALVERANTITGEGFEAAWTPATGPFYAHHGRLFPEGTPAAKRSEDMAAPGDQFTLF